MNLSDKQVYYRMRNIKQQHWKKLNNCLEIRENYYGRAAALGVRLNDDGCSWNLEPRFLHELSVAFPTLHTNFLFCLHTFRSYSIAPSMTAFPQSSWKMKILAFHFFSIKSVHRLERKMLKSSRQKEAKIGRIILKRFSAGFVSLSNMTFLPRAVTKKGTL